MKTLYAALGMACLFAAFVGEPLQMLSSAAAGGFAIAGGICCVASAIQERVESRGQHAIQEAHKASLAASLEVLEKGGPQPKTSQPGIEPLEGPG